MFSRDLEGKYLLKVEIKGGERVSLLEFYYPRYAQMMTLYEEEIGELTLLFTDTR